MKIEVCRTSEPSPGAKNRARRAFTLVEVLTALVVLGVLTSLLLAKTEELRDDALDAQCRSNLRQWGEAVRFYAADNDGYYAVRDNWAPFGASTSWLAVNSEYSRYIGLGGVREFLRTCPLQERVESGTPTYAMNYPSVNGVQPPRYSIPFDAIPDKSEFPLITDAAAGIWEVFAFYGTYEDPEEGAPEVFELSQPPLDEQRHLGEMNAVFADGHVRRLHWEPRSENDPDSFVAQWERWTSLETEP